MDTAMEFDLVEASLLDTADMVNVHCIAWINDDIWKPLMNNVSIDTQQKWLAKGFAKRNSLPDRKVFKIIDRTTGKIVAYSTLCIPYTLTKEQLAFLEGDDPPPEGHNKALAAVFFARLEISTNYGYDPTKDYLKRGTMVHPDYQRKALGTWLTRCCNEIVDQSGGRTFVLARKSSKKLFENHGYKVLGTEDIDMVKYGGLESDGKSWMMMREPHVNVSGLK